MSVILEVQKKPARISKARCHCLQIPEITLVLVQSAYFVSEEASDMEVGLAQDSLQETRSGEW